MSLAGMSYSYRLQNTKTLEGILNPTTRWRQLPVSNTNDTLSWLRFENIAGDVIDPPVDVIVTETRPNLLPVPALQIGQQFMIEWVKSYEVRQGQASVRIKNQKQQGVSASGEARVLRVAPLPVAAPQAAVELNQEPLEELAELQIN